MRRRLIARIAPLTIFCVLGCSVDQNAVAPLGDAGVEDGRAMDAPATDAPISDSALDTRPVDSRVPIEDGCVPGPELCDGIDNDCDPTTPVDGAEDPMVGVACDDADSDLCEEGLTECIGGAIVCVEPPMGDVDVCDGTDNDCDPSTADGAGDPDVGMPCDGGDADMCEEGTWNCVGGGLSCDDTTGDASETCNGMDDDCDGSFDEGAGCGCAFRNFRGHAYQFCEDERSWTSARDTCDGRGYHLVTIDDSAENDFVRDESRALRDDRDWWLGYNDRATEGSWVWDETGADGAFTAWRGTEPNGGAGESCAEMVRDSPGGWNDDDCNSRNRYVCEAP